jgi:hypothetical protein
MSKKELEKSPPPTRRRSHKEILAAGGKNVTAVTSALDGVTLKRMNALCATGTPKSVILIQLLEECIHSPRMQTRLKLGGYTEEEIRKELAEAQSDASQRHED